MKKTYLILILAIFFLFAEILGSMSLVLARSVPQLPAPGTMVRISPGFTPSLLRGIKIHPDQPLKLTFLLQEGDQPLKEPKLKIEVEQLIKYFLASLAVKEEDLWVNLSPHEEQRIIPDAFGRTEMGRDLLAQDYLLKQLTASLLYPEDEFGQAFWERIYDRAYELYGTIDIPVNTFHKVWIVPAQVSIYETEDAAFIIHSELDVLMEQDYLAVEKNKSGYELTVTSYEPATDNSQLITTMESEIIKEIILPEIKKEVNEGQNFALLRQIYHSFILAVWYKRNLQESFLGQVYADQEKVKGVEVLDLQSKQKIYDQYVAAYQKGVYNYIREDYDQSSQQMIPRKYFAGGLQFSQTYAVMNSSRAGADVSPAIIGDLGPARVVEVDIAMLQTPAHRSPNRPSSSEKSESDSGDHVKSFVKRFPIHDLDNVIQAIRGEHGSLRQLFENRQTPFRRGDFIFEPLGEGGQAATFRVYHTRIHKYFAIKDFIPKPLKSLSKEFMSKVFEYLNNEIAMIRKKNEFLPPTVASRERLIILGRGSTYFAMTLVPGKRMWNWLSENRPHPSPYLMRDVILSVALELADAHAQGIVHKDVKPENIMIVQRAVPFKNFLRQNVRRFWQDYGFWKTVRLLWQSILWEIDHSKSIVSSQLLDFGVAHPIHRISEDVISGTPPYMAPEQEDGQNSFAVDIYALGVLAYQLVTGEFPHQSREHKSTRNVFDFTHSAFQALPENLQDLIQLMLSEDPRQRPMAMQVALVLSSENQLKALEDMLKNRIKDFPNFAAVFARHMTNGHDQTVRQRLLQLFFRLESSLSKQELLAIENSFRETDRREEGRWRSFSDQPKTKGREADDPFSFFLRLVANARAHQEQEEYFRRWAQAAALDDTMSLPVVKESATIGARPRRPNNDPALLNQAKNPGGIKFDSQFMDMQVEREGRGVELQFDPSLLENIDVDGAVPVIQNILYVPPGDIPAMFLGRSPFSQNDISLQANIQ